MRHLMTIFELSTRSDSELQALFRVTAAALVCTDENSTDQRNALATLDNIAAVLRSRDAPQP